LIDGGGLSTEMDDCGKLVYERINASQIRREVFTICLRPMLPEDERDEADENLALNNVYAHNIFSEKTSVQVTWATWYHKMVHKRV